MIADGDGLRAFLAAGGLAGRRSLALPSRRYRGCRFLELLAEHPDAAGLEELSLPENRLGPKAARPLAASDKLRSLRRLDLAGNPLGDEGAETLARAELPALVELRLAGCGIGPRGARALASSPLAARLERLVLSGNPLGDDGARALADGDWPRLRALDLARARLGARAAWALAAAPSLAALVALRLTRNRLDASAAAALGASTALAALETLELSRNPLGDDGARALARMSGLPSLRALALTRTGLRADGLRALRDSPRLAAVALELRGNFIEPLQLGPEAAHVDAPAERDREAEALGAGAGCLGAG